MVRIAVLAHNLRAGGGLVGTLNLLRALKSVSSTEQFFIIYPKGYGYEEIELPADSKVYIYSGSHSLLQRSWFEAVSLPKIVRGFRPDVICGLGNLGLSRPCARQAVLIHTPYFLYDNKHWPDARLTFRIRLAALRRQMAKSAAKTDLIFCQTPVMKMRFAERFKYPADKIRLVRWPPPDEIMRSVGSMAPGVLDKSGGDLFVLLLTRYLPHRNPKVLIPLCSRYAPQLRQQRIKFITTLDDETDVPSRAFLNETSRRGLGDIIVNAGPLSRQEVSRYMWHSDVLWLPTYMETLCLPFLEAMSLGVPILAPDLDFARYVCGEAAVFYDPWDIDSAFAKIMLLRQDSALRKVLAERGKIELADRNRFSANWEEVAGDMLRELRRLAQQPNQGGAG
jgi:glycosyltransferase involved in cell wall biosynthesis